MIRVLVCGVNGQMGRVLSECIAESENMELVAGVDVAANFNGVDFPVYSRISDCTEEVDVIIDFSRPAALKFNLAFARDRGAAVVIATTGYTESDKFLIAEYSREIPIFFSANMSLGVNLQIDLCKKAAEFLAVA